MSDKKTVSWSEAIKAINDIDEIEPPTDLYDKAIQKYNEASKVIADIDSIGYTSDMESTRANFGGAISNSDAREYCKKH